MLTRPVQGPSRMYSFRRCRPKGLANLQIIGGGSGLRDCWRNQRSSTARAILVIGSRRSFDNTTRLLLAACWRWFSWLFHCCCYFNSPNTVTDLNSRLLKRVGNHCIQLRCSPSFCRTSSALGSRQEHQAGQPAITG